MSMVEKYSGAVRLENGKPVPIEKEEVCRDKTMAYRILKNHEKRPFDGKMHIGFDAMLSHDITYVGIIQTARASGMTKFPIPYALTNCHNSLCAVGGTINADDHAFGLSAAKKYGGIYVPANQAVIHQFAREKMAACGKMILGSDSHTRYGCYGTLGVGEGGGELVKQLLENTWDITKPEVVLVWVEGKLPHGIGPHDAALALVGESFPNGFVKNKILEFAGPGIADLSMDFRTGVDVMTTETSCLSSIWETDETVKEFYENVGRAEAYRPLKVQNGACYDAMLTLHLDRLESMIALPFHPSNVYTVHEVQKNAKELLKDFPSMVDENGTVRVKQGIIVGCAGGMYENMAAAAEILKDKSIGNGDFELSVYPSSTSVLLAMNENGRSSELLQSGTLMKSCFCGPCFGAGDTPQNGTLSIRHATRNFPNREGSKPSGSQMAGVALMDARSIAATAANGGVLTAATDVAFEEPKETYKYSDTMYEKRCYFGFGKADPATELQFGPNIRDWPQMPELKDNLLVRFCAVIEDEVTTTDELIPSGETSAYRSNPIALAEFALSRRKPNYVNKSKAVRELKQDSETIKEIMSTFGTTADATTVGSTIFACKPGDGSAREQAASCQKVLGGFANVCYEYATKRYRSNCINWGLVPFTADKDFLPEEDDWLFVPELRKGIFSGNEDFEAVLLSKGTKKQVRLHVADLSPEERKILTDGCLINYYVNQKRN